MYNAEEKPAVILYTYTLVAMQGQLHQNTKAYEEPGFNLGTTVCHINGFGIGSYYYCIIVGNTSNSCLSVNAISLID